MKNINKRLQKVAKDLEKLAQNDIDNITENIRAKLTEIQHLMEDMNLFELDDYDKKNLKLAFEARRKLDGFILNITLHQDKIKNKK